MTNNPPNSIDTPFTPVDKPIPLQHLFALAKKDLTFEEIGTLVGVSRQAVQQRLAWHGVKKKVSKSYRENKAEILEDKQEMLLNSLDSGKVEKMQGRDLVVATAILEDKIRLIRGESTSNVSVHTVVDSLTKRMDDIANKLSE